MRNKVGLRDLFGENRKAIKDFLDWVKENEDEWCSFDYNHILFSLEFNSSELVEKFVHFHNGNILDWLEGLGYKIGIRVKNDKYIPTVYYDSRFPFYTNSGGKDRKQVIYKAIQKAIEHYDKR